MTESIAGNGKTPDEIAKELLATPRFKVQPPSGKGYIIVGAQPLPRVQATSTEPKMEAEGEVEAPTFRRNA
jgi:hypothetical protein